MIGKNATNIRMKFLALIYLIALLYITLLAGRRYGKLFEQNNYNFQPFVAKWICISHFAILHDREKLFLIKEIGGNFLLFMPFSWFMHIAFSREFNKKATSFIIVLSVFLIEIIQYTLHIGTFDVDDLILNISGGIAGVFVYDALKKRFCK